AARGYGLHAGAARGALAAGDAARRLLHGTRRPGLVCVQPGAARGGAERNRMSSQHIVVVGAGITGLSAAYDLLGAGHRVTLLEGADHTGGLAAGFRDERWEWPLE